MFHFSLAPCTDKNIPEQLREFFPFLDCVILKAYSLTSLGCCHVSQSMFYFFALHRGALCQPRKAREIAPSPSVFLTHCRALLCFSFIVNNAFSLHAYSSLKVCWKHFMKIRSCLKLKLMSNLNLLAFYFSPTPFLILFDMQAVYTELIEFV